MATVQTKAIAFFSLCFGFGLSGCYDGHEGEGAGATDSMGTDGDGDGDGDDGDDDAPTAAPPENVELVPETMSRRLTRAELDNTLRDLMGDATSPARTYLSEEDFSPYDNDYNSQDVSRTLIESMEVLAIDVADRLINDPARRGMIVPCEPTGPGDAACFQQAVEVFGRLALRRPLTDDEVAAYVTLQAYSTENIAEVDNDFYTGIALVISAIVQDPDFLYRIEAGAMTSEDGVFKLNDFEIASRISYLLWGSTPDDELIADAQAGNLAEPEGRDEVIARILQSDKAKNQLYRYHAMWLGYRAIPHDQQLVSAFNQETSALLQRVVFDDAASYTELFTSSETYVDTFLADHYGLPQPDGGEGWVSYDSDRSGILSHGSVLAAFSKFTDTSPTQRGILINERLRCTPTPTPPPTVDTDAPPSVPDNPNACKIDTYLNIRAQASCDSCHQNMDPIGMGLENYDLAGRFRTVEDGNPDCPISGEGELPGVGTFSGPAELAARLVESGELERCATKQYMEYALGRPLAVADAPVVDTAYEGFETNGFDFKQMMADYAVAEAFGFRRETGN
ncbi:MAG: DUF1592 domain-containing protein [Nannocystaceae bacterium]|nr:DUF1592 domain-containing protein [Nannocystaceae bacterium]